MQPNAQQGLRKRHLVILYLCICAILLVGVYNRWQANEAASRLGANTSSLSTTPTSVQPEDQAPTSETEYPDSAALAEQIIALEEEYETLLAELERQTRAVPVTELAEMDQMQRRLDYLNTIAVETTDPTIRAAVPSVAFGLIPLHERFAMHTDDWQFSDEQNFIEDLYQQIGFQNAELEQYFESFTCTHSHCDLQFSELPDHLYSLMQAEHQALSGKQIRYHPYLSLSIHSSPSTNRIRLIIGRKP